jgi:hypothetical protein
MPHLFRTKDRQRSDSPTPGAALPPSCDQNEVPSTVLPTLQCIQHLVCGHFADQQETAAFPIAMFARAIAEFW